MIREFQIKIYLIIFKVLFTLCKIFPLQKKVTFIMSYGENHFFIYEEMKKRNLDYEVVFLYKSTFKYDITNYPNVKKCKFETANLIDMLKSIYHISTSTHVIIDNYFGFLSEIQFKKGVQCIQLWHAAGAIKKFGLLTPSFRRRSKRAQKRFLKVYNNFHKIVVGSDALADIYMGAFGLSSEQMVKTGIPRTDLFFDHNHQQQVIAALLRDNPNIKGKKVILYTPTFRDKELAEFQLHLDIDAMYQELKDEYVLFMKVHPAIRSNICYEDKYPTFVYDYSLYPNVNDLFLVTDILVTDYSSTPFEFCLLNKPMIFFAYDFTKYTKKRGIIGDYQATIPGPVVTKTTELIAVIQKGVYNMKNIADFSFKWNQYSDGNSSRKFVDSIF
ncbi:CDP-glycerol glycerophosphotransferase family protein [Microbacteriaceae bacterium 4G12]